MANFHTLRCSCLSAMDRQQRKINFKATFVFQWVPQKALIGYEYYYYITKYNKWKRKGSHILALQPKWDTLPPTSPTTGLIIIPYGKFLPRIKKHSFFFHEIKCDGMTSFMDFHDCFSMSNVWFENNWHEVWHVIKQVCPGK